MAFRMPREASAFSLDVSRKSRGGRRQERDHLAYIRSLPCCVTGVRRNTEAAHVRYADPAYGKGKTPMGSKPDDRWCVPLSPEMHRTGEDAQHSDGERAWWDRHGIDPLAVAAALYSCSGDVDAGELVIRATVQKARKAVVS